MFTTTQLIILGICIGIDLVLIYGLLDQIFDFDIAFKIRCKIDHRWYVKEYEKRYGRKYLGNRH